MAAAGWLPTLSQIQSVPSEQLREAARIWRATGTRWEQVSAQLRDEAAQKVVWQGATADALEARTYNDWVITVGKANQLHEAADIAERGADQLDGAQQHTLDAVAEARADGFRVAEDLSVTDTRTGGSREGQAARQAQAKAHAAYIRHCAAGLVAVDREISANMLAATQGLGTIGFGDTPLLGIDQMRSPKTEHNGVQLVGYGHQPEAPSPGNPTPPHKPTKTAQDVHKALDPLPSGMNKGVKELPTPEEIREKFGILTQNAPDAPPTKRPYAGTRRILDDGTIIGIRESQKWGPTLDVTYPDGTNQKVHLPEPVEGAKPPPASPQTPPVISAPPTLPPELNHPPVAPLPVQSGHPPITLPPTQVVDPATLPPWLQNPLPPGFQVTPSQPPPIFDWDVPDAPPLVAPMPPPSGPPITIPSPPPVSPGDAAVGGALAGAGAVGAWILSQLRKLSHPFSP
ncbi:hypothetical protein MSM1_11060 [Mycobacterium sp. SM1]|uniref:WXG100 family type VII secretion target n=1 Tax=Mycobacterium sp. SM1 TaxID=2816243 RepID=UPI001BCF50B3|nr:hypothetical protein [Mycobacterium sp. SM1]MBS4728851.1 hypothetical protein [Mycobacterium sp. SM1]